MGIASDFDRSTLSPEIAALMERTRQRRLEAGLAVRISDRPELGVVFAASEETLARWRASAARRGATVDAVVEG